jgi:hypothetical protein
VIQAPRCSGLILHESATATVPLKAPALPPNLHDSTAYVNPEASFGPNRLLCRPSSKGEDSG